MQDQTTFKIYYDGKLAYRATYLPLLKRKLVKAGNDLNDKIVQLQQVK